MPNTTQAEASVLMAAGWSYEYPGFWLNARGEINMADGLSCNGIMWEVQCGNHVSAGPFESPLEAMEWAAKLKR